MLSTYGAGTLEGDGAAYPPFATAELQSIDSHVERRRRHRHRPWSGAGGGVMKHHIKERPHDQLEVAGPEPVLLDPDLLEQEEDERSLDLVQRLVISSLAFVVGGGISCVLALYTSISSDLDPVSRVGLWIMSGVTGLLTAIVILVINRRHAYSPFLLLGLLPMAIVAFWVLR
jgi:hypothetical protein